MKYKNLEAFLTVAIALGLIEWSGRSTETRNIGDLLPAGLTGINRQPGLYNRNFPFQDRLRFKEEQSVIDNILSWEDSQKRGDWAPQQNLLTFPLVAQNSGRPADRLANRIDSEDHGYNTDVSSPLSVSASSCGLSPTHSSVQYDSDIGSPQSSCSDGEALLGAVGYTPTRTTHDFDIDELISDDYSSFSAANCNALGRAALNYGQNQLSSIDKLGIKQNHVVASDLTEDAGEELEQLLRVSLCGPQFKTGSHGVGLNFDPFETDVSMTNNQQSDLPDDLAETFMNIDVEAVRRAHSGTMPSLADVVGNIKIEEIEDLFLTDFENGASSSSDKMLSSNYETGYESVDKGSFPEFSSYDTDDLEQEPLFEIEKNIKKERFSPFEDLASSCSSIEGNDLEILSSKSGSFLPENKKVSTDFSYLKRGKGARSKTKGPVWSDLPYTEDDLINMSVEKFNTILQSFDAARQMVAKDLRRKGKNKLAARNCRKRKLEAIDILDSSVGTMEQQREALLKESSHLQEETEQIRRKTEYLYNHIFSSLRDENGLPYSSSEYSLQYTSDGSVYLVPDGKAKAVSSTSQRTSKTGKVEPSR